MSAAPLERPAKHEVLHVLAATIAADPAAVFAALDARLDTRQGPGSSMRYLADANAGVIVVQGSWWYRAEYRVVPVDVGTVIEHELLTIARVAERAALVAGARTAADGPLAFHAVVRSIRTELE